MALGYDSEDSEDMSDTLTFAQTLQKQGMSVMSEREYVTSISGIVKSRCHRVSDNAPGTGDEPMIASCSSANNAQQVAGGGRLKGRKKAKKILAQVKAGDAHSATQLETLKRSFRKRHLKRYDTSNVDLLNRQIDELKAVLESADMHNESRGTTTTKLQRLQSEKTMRLEVNAQRKAERRRTAEYDRNNPKSHRKRCAKADKANPEGHRKRCAKADIANPAGHRRRSNIYYGRHASEILAKLKTKYEQHEKRDKLAYLKYKRKVAHALMWATFLRRPSPALTATEDFAGQMEIMNMITIPGPSCARMDQWWIDYSNDYSRTTADSKGTLRVICGSGLNRTLLVKNSCYGGYIPIGPNPKLIRSYVTGFCAIKKIIPILIEDKLYNHQ